MAAASSVLQRARATLRAHDPSEPGRPLPADEQRLVERFVRAWARNDIPSLAALLREGVILRMPPELLGFRGRAAVAEFFATAPRRRAPGPDPAGAHLRKRPARPGRLRDPARRTRLVLTLAVDGIAAITGFRDPSVFDVFALPAVRPRV